MNDPETDLVDEKIDLGQGRKCGSNAFNGKEVVRKGLDDWVSDLSRSNRDLESDTGFLTSRD